MKHKKPTFCFIDDDADEHYLLSKDFHKYAPDAELQCFARFEEFYQFLQIKMKEKSIRPVLLLDLNMPDMTGYKVIKKLRKDEDFNHLPIVVYTTSQSPNDVRQSYAAGANAFITKPSDQARSKTVITEIVNYWSTCVTVPARREQQ